MYVTPEQIQAAVKANVETMLSLASTQFAAMERFSSLGAGAAKAAFDESVANTRALAGAKDAQEFFALQSAFAQPALEKSIALSMSLYEVAAQSHAEITKVAEKRTAELNETLASTLDKVSKNAPAGSDVAVAAMKSMLSAINSG
ncbi:MAG: TIGR01841 family phasin, partial [Betaproteobacteria bacterium]|nr:TIGR01841 family phasin [Betaproteobacteria bacterium]